MRAALIFLGRRVALLFWHLVVPLAASALALRMLVPSANDPHVAALLVRASDQQPVLAAAFTFLLVSILVRYWSPHLPGARLPGHETRRSHAALVIAGAAAAAIAGITLSHAFQSARIVSTSMVPTILPHERALVDRGAYADGREPRRGDVIVFHRDGIDEGEQGLLTKRVIAVPGDHVTVVNSTPVVNGHEIPTCDAGPFTYLGASRVARGRLVVEWLDGHPYLTIHERGPHVFSGYVVKPGEVFVLGDNRGLSNDSRSWEGSPGIKLADVRGRIDRVLFGDDRRGRIDWQRVGARLDSGLHLPGVDLAPLRAGIERCLAAPPSGASVVSQVARP